MSRVDAGWQILSHVMQHQSFAEVIGRGITAEMFGPKRESVQHRLFVDLQHHYTAYRVVPSVGLVMRKYPNAQLNLTVEEPIAYYLDLFLNRYLMASGAKVLEQAASSMHADPMATLTALHTQISGYIGKTISTHGIEHYGVGYREDITRYKQRASGGMLGIATPWESWNTTSLGWQPEDYVVVTARTGVGKTWMLLWCAQHASLQKKRVLFFTKEMGVEALRRRMHAMEFGLPYRRFRHGQLTTAERKMFFRSLKRRHREVTDGLRGPIRFEGGPSLTLPGIEAAIDAWRPDIVFVDGVYLAEDPTGRATSDQERAKAVSRYARTIPQRFKIPLIVSTQIKRQTGTVEKQIRTLSLNDTAFSDAFSQDGDVVLALMQTQDMRHDHEMYVKVLKMREDEAIDWMVSWDLSTMKNTFHEIPMSFGDAALAQPAERLDAGEDQVMPATAWDTTVDET